jgi:hypothetical protein
MYNQHPRRIVTAHFPSWRETNTSTSCFSSGDYEDPVTFDGLIGVSGLKAWLVPMC